MDDLEFGKHILSFTTVGKLRELLKYYSDDTPITVCGTPGLFYPNNEQQYITLETADCYWDWYDILSDIESPAIVGQEYMDF